MITPETMAIVMAMLAFSASQSTAVSFGNPEPIATHTTQHAHTHTRQKYGKIQQYYITTSIHIFRESYYIEGTTFKIQHCTLRAGIYFVSLIEGTTVWQNIN